MAANSGGKLALRRNGGRHIKGLSTRTSQYTDYYTQSTNRDLGSLSKSTALKTSHDQAASSRSTVPLAMGPVEGGTRPSYQPPSCMLHLELPLPPLPCSEYLLCRQSTGDTIVGMATGTSKVSNVEDPHRDRHAHSEGTRPPQGVLPPLPSPSSSLYKRPTSVWTEEYVWTLLTGDTQTCGQDGSTRVSARVAPSAEQSFEQLCQSRPTASCSASVTVEHTTTTTTSSKPHNARSVLCTTASAVGCSPSPRSPVLVPDAGPLLPTCRTLTATASSGKTTASNVHSSSHCSAACNSSQSPSSLSVIDLTATEDDIGDEDQDFDSLFADVDMAQFEESCLASQPNDHSMTNTVLSQGSKLPSPSNKRGLNCPVSNMQSGFRVEMYGDCGGGGVGSGHVVLQTGPPFRSGKEKASINHRVEEKKSSLSSCPVCAMAFQPSVTQKEADAHIRQCLDALTIVLD